MNQAKHIAIIMDGNGRWAKRQGLKRVKGHEQGAEVVRDITTYASNVADIKFLTLYAFSTENWKRPKLEVEFLMKLLQKYLQNEKEIYLKNGVRFRAIGDISRFSKSLQKTIKDVEEYTKECTKLTQNLALNYGSRDEIIRACNTLQKNNEAITEESLTQALDCSTDVDILIRTGGDKRISNYLLWQASYAELFFTDTMWPEFSPKELEEIICSFTNIERRFGAVLDEE